MCRAHLLRSGNSIWSWPILGQDGFDLGASQYRGQARRVLGALNTLNLSQLLPCTKT
jgi:hypothetical protein